MKTTHDDEFLRAALVGYEAQMRSISAKMETIRQQLRGRRTAQEPAVLGVPPSVGKVKQRKHRISAEGRERIRQAQILRWKNTKRTAA